MQQTADNVAKTACNGQQATRQQTTGGLRHAGNTAQKMTSSRQRMPQTTDNRQQTTCKRTRAHARCNRKHTALPHFVCGGQRAAQHQQHARSIVLDNQCATRHRRHTQDATYDRCRSMQQTHAEPKTRSRQCNTRDGDPTKGVRTLAHLGSASGSLLRWPWGFACDRVLRTRMRSRASTVSSFDSTTASLPSSAGSSASEASGTSRGHRTSHVQFRLLAPVPSVAFKLAAWAAAVPRQLAVPRRVGAGSEAPKAPARLAGGRGPLAVLAGGHEARAHAKLPRLRVRLPVPRLSPLLRARTHARTQGSTGPGSEFSQLHCWRKHACYELQKRQSHEASSVTRIKALSASAGSRICLN
jgi:hypothetical protein